MSSDLVGEVESQVVNTGAQRAAGDTQGVHEPMKDATDCIGVKLDALDGDEDERTGASLLQPALKVVLEPAPGARVQRQ